jgi:hypothetical protein
MNARSLLTGLLLLLAAGGIVYVLAGDRQQAAEPAVTFTDDPGQAGQAPAATAARDALPPDGVVVYYFHGRQRCYTCNKMENLADRVVFDQFANYLNDGWVVFRSINVQTPETSHFVQDYELRSAAIVMVERAQGQDVRWRRLDEVWTKIRNDDDYRSYIAENLTACLREVGLEKI